MSLTLAFLLIKEINTEDIIDICDEIDNLTIINYKNIIVNIMEHSLVPIHIKLNETEKIKLKKDLSLNSYDYENNTNYFSDNLNLINFFPNYKKVEVLNAGHWVHAEHLNDFIKEIEIFLKS